MPSGLSALNNYRAILLRKDSGSQFPVWMEQAAPCWVREILALVAKQDAAMVLPYYDSGQVTGYAAGTQEELNGSITWSAAHALAP